MVARYALVGVPGFSMSKRRRKISTKNLRLYLGLPRRAWGPFRRAGIPAGTKQLTREQVELVIAAHRLEESRQLRAAERKRQKGMLSPSSPLPLPAPPGLNGLRERVESS